MNKSQLIERVARDLRTSRLQATRLVQCVLDAIEGGLREDGSVTLTGFGTFEVKDRKARTGRNPHTGEPIQIESGRRIGFRVGKSLRDAL